MCKHLRKTLLLFGILTSSWAYSQSYTGIWQGSITAEGLLNKTKLVLNVKSHTGNIITGKAYLYSDFIYLFQGVFDVVGTIDQKNWKLTELRLLNSRLPDTLHYLCIKYSNVKYSADDTAQYLQGTWGNSKGRCPPGTISLRKPLNAKMAEAGLPVEIVAKINEDKSSNINFLGTVLSKPMIITVRSNKLKLEISDYLNEDQDTVTVYLNREAIISNLQIRKKVYQKTIHFDHLSGINEIIMYANNLGRVPPNTCILTIDDGYRKQQINILSTREVSAALYFKYEDPSIKPNR